MNIEMRTSGLEPRRPLIMTIEMSTSGLEPRRDLSMNIEMSTTRLEPRRSLTMNIEMSTSGLISTKVMADTHSDEVRRMTRDGSQLEIVQDFNYLGS